MGTSHNEPPSSDATFHSISALITFPRNDADRPRWKPRGEGHVARPASEVTSSQEIREVAAKRQAFGLAKKAGFAFWKAVGWSSWVGLGAPIPSVILGNTTRKVMM